MILRPITLRSFKTDGQVQRRIEAELELANDLGCVVWTQPGTEIHLAGGLRWPSSSLVRHVFVYGAWLDLLEIHNADGSPREIYMNVLSPIEHKGGEIRCVDYELDILKRGEASAVILDEDEFEAAIDNYDYSKDVIERCRHAAQCGLRIADGWEFKLSTEDALATFARLSSTIG